MSVAGKQHLNGLTNGVEDVSVVLYFMHDHRRRRHRGVR